MDAGFKTRSHFQILHYYPVFYKPTNIMKRDLIQFNNKKKIECAGSRNLRKKMWTYVADRLLRWPPGA